MGQMLNFLQKVKSILQDTSIGSLGRLSRYLVINSPAGCNYLKPGQQLPIQLHCITNLWPVPNYTAWSQRHVYKLLRLITWHQNGWEANRQVWSSNHCKPNHQICNL